MIPELEFRKIDEAISAGRLRVRVLTKEEYEKAEKDFKAKKQKENLLK